MTDENKITEKQPECLCHNKTFRKFLVIAGGSFVGVFCALSLFAALHKPPMPQMLHPFVPIEVHRQCPCGCYHHKHHNKEFRDHYRDKEIKHYGNKQFPPRPQKPIPPAQQ